MADKSGKANVIHASQIAPCGMNCRLCRAYVRDRNPCPGCGGDDAFKTKVRIECYIKNCEKLTDAEVKFCFNCDSFPCARLKHLDQRYRRNYGMSMVENLEYMKSFGIGRFVRKEKQKWTCPKCGEILCVHEPRCPSCQHKWR